MAGYKPTWLEINLDNYIYNLSQIRKKIGASRKLFAVVKANGYGCGSVMLAKHSNADGFAVARLDEAIELRKNSISKQIIVLGYIPEEDIDEIIKYNITPVAYSSDFLYKLDKKARLYNKKARVHIKIDTGMHRLGINADNAISFIKRNFYSSSQRLQNIILEGIMTHFSVADEADKSYTEWQFSRFKKIIDEFKEKNIMFHTANSATIIDLENMYLDGVRAGIMIYGLYPSDEVVKENIRIKPVCSFKTSVAFVKKVKPGSSISYVRTYTTNKETKIATLPVGYADGYNRLLSNKGEVLIKGKRYPVVGNICMDMCMVDIGNDDIKIGDEAVLIGKQGNDEITIEEIAKKINTINYEVQCSISRRVPRVYIKENKIINVVKYL